MLSFMHQLPLDMQSFILSSVPRCARRRAPLLPILPLCRSLRPVFSGLDVLPILIKFILHWLFYLAYRPSPCRWSIMFVAHPDARGCSREHVLVVDVDKGKYLVDLEGSFYESPEILVLHHLHIIEAELLLLI